MRVGSQVRVVAVHDETAPVVPPKERESDVRLVLVSDTHGVAIPHALFPEGDLLLHAGDHTASGTEEELRAALAWLEGLAARFPHGCLTVGGNHDVPLDAETCGDGGGEELARWTLAKGVRLLRHEAVTVAGICFFGSPFVSFTPSRQAMAADDPARCVGFQRDEATLEVLYAAIPPECDVLMTHTPSRGILDASVQYGGVPRPQPVAVGSRALRQWLERPRRPALHVFGHEHDARGTHSAALPGCLCCNAAAVDGDRGTLRHGGGYTLKPHFRATVVDLRLV